MPMGSSSRGPVRVPEGQLRPEGVEGEPLTISHSTVGLMIPLQWFDEHGLAHNDVFFLVGDQVYQPPESERWAADLGPVKEPLRREILRRVKGHLSVLIKDAVRDVLKSEGVIGDSYRVAAVPTDDGVDVLDDVADEVANELAPAG